MTDTSHIVVINHVHGEILHLHCERCGADMHLTMPTSFGEMVNANDAFVARHKGCAAKAEPSTLWVIEDSEECHDDSEIDDAICTYLDEIGSEVIPAKITLTGMRQMVPKVEAFTHPYTGVLGQLIEAWGEDYSDPSGDDIKPTETMLAAEREFVAKVLAELQEHVHPCERTGETREIDVLEWARENGDEDIVKALEARKA